MDTTAGDSQGALFAVGPAPSDQGSGGVRVRPAVVDSGRATNARTRPEFRLFVDSKGWLAKVVVKSEQLTGAWSSDPYEALEKVAWYMNNRNRVPGRGEGKK